MKKTLFLLILLAIALMGSASVAIAHGGERENGTEFDDALGHLRESRQAFKDARAEAAGERRAGAQDRMEEKRKQTLLNLIDIQIKHWEKVQARVDGMPNITDELKAQLGEEIASAIADLNGMKPLVEAAEGRDAIRELAKQIRDLFKSKRDIAKNIVEAIHASRLSIATSKAEDRASGIKAKIEKIKTEGSDTGELEDDLSEAEEAINDAREAAGRGEFREANEDLKGAYQIFRGIAEKAKGL